MRAVFSASIVALVLTGCTTSDPIDVPTDSGIFVTEGSAGSTGPGGGLTGGGAGTVGSGTAGSIGGQAGDGAQLAGSNGQAGTAGGARGNDAGASDAGQAGNRGQAGSGGLAGSGGKADGGSPDAGGNDASGGVPTFTELYTNIFNNSSYASNCAGSPCHDPGTQKGLDFSTKMKGYTTVLGKIKVGAPSSSKLMSVLSSGSMPQARPKMPAADQAKVSAWIAAGAPNN